MYIYQYKFICVYLMPHCTASQAVSNCRLVCVEAKSSVAGEGRKSFFSLKIIQFFPRDHCSAAEGQSRRRRCADTSGATESDGCCSKGLIRGGAAFEPPIVMM